MLDANSGHSVRVSRQTWALQILAEQLYSALPPDSPIGKAVGDLVDAQRGITVTAVRRVTEDLLHSRYIVARGVGDDAIWEIAGERRAEVDAMFRALSACEQTATRRAAHDAVAISEAWSKTFLAAAPTRSLA